MNSERRSQMKFLENSQTYLPTEFKRTTRVILERIDKVFPEEIT